MLMSHRLEPTRVWLEYRVTIETSKRLTPVTPMWLRASGCDPTSSYTVEGGGAPGSTDVRSAQWPVPVSGRIVAAGAHLHGSAKSLVVSQPRCGDRTLIEHRPRYGNPDDPVYRVRPRLHEPGPVATGYFLSARGIAVRQGELLTVTGRYDAQIAHPAVMAITHVYIAPDDSAPAGCEPLPSDRRVEWSRRPGRATVAPAQIPLTGLDARGRPVEIARAAGTELRRGRRRARRPPRLAFRPAQPLDRARRDRHVALARRGAPRRLPRQRSARRRRAAHAPGRGLRPALHRARHLQPLLLPAPGDDASDARRAPRLRRRNALAPAETARHRQPPSRGARDVTAAGRPDRQHPDRHERAGTADEPPDADADAPLDELAPNGGGTWQLETAPPDSCGPPPPRSPSRCSGRASQQTALATTYTVTRTDDPSSTHGACATGGACSLREALNTVNDDPSPPDVVNVPAGTYATTRGNFDITRASRSRRRRATTTLTGSGLGRVLQVGGARPARHGARGHDHRRPHGGGRRHRLQLDRRRRLADP